jgi:hypothetical protein
MDQLRLVDHGCEIVNGLTELYVGVAKVRPEKKAEYQAPLQELFNTILKKGRNDHGLLYSWFNPKTGEHSKDLCDTWGYVYDGFYTLWLIDGTAAYRQAVVKALSNLKGNYVGACWGEQSADAYADSIEGALNLLNREPVEGVADWVDSQTRLMWNIQKPDGIIEGWHGDGNFARTSLMYALWKTQGITVAPWRADVRFGAVRDADGVHVTIASSHPWEGRLIFDTPRHQTRMRLPLDYPRINRFPEWFTVENDKGYELTREGGEPRTVTAKELTGGFPVNIGEGGSRWLTVRPR